MPPVIGVRTPASSNNMAATSTPSRNGRRFLAVSHSHSRPSVTIPWLHDGQMRDNQVRPAKVRSPHWLRDSLPSSARIPKSRQV